MTAPGNKLLHQRNDAIPSIDGLRAVSIILVIATHLSIAHSLPDGTDGYINRLINGRIGVDTFFVISGFLITFLLLKERERTGSVNFRHFYIRRALRIFPAFYTYLLFILVLSVLGWIVVGWGALITSALYLSNFNIAETNWFVGHTWSLSVEEQFYLLFPVFLIRLDFTAMRKVWISSLFIGSIARSLQYKFPQYSDYVLAGFFMHADLIVSGCFIAFIYHYRKAWLTTLSNSMPRAIPYLAAILASLIYTNDYDPYYDTVLIPVGRTIGNLALCCILIYFIFPKKTYGYRVLNNGFMIWTGRLSYGLYLWQQYFTATSTHWVNLFPQNLLLLVLVATVSYFCIEQPFLKLKERFKGQPAAGTI